MRSQQGIPLLSKEARQLLKEASQDPNGFIYKIAQDEGWIISTNRKRFNEVGDPRSTAIWEGALDELEQKGFVKAEDRLRGVFKVTSAGYATAVQISE